MRLCGIAFCVVLAEGAISDWSSVYLQQELAATSGLVGGGSAAFSLTMTIARLAGGRIVQRLVGEVAAVRASVVGRVSGVRAAAAIAAMNTAGFTGFLAGPPLIGFVAEGMGRRTRIGMLVAIGLVMIAFAATVRPGMTCLVVLSPDMQHDPRSYIGDMVVSSLAEVTPEVACQAYAVPLRTA